LERSTDWDEFPVARVSWSSCAPVIVKTFPSVGPSHPSQAWSFSAWVISTTPGDEELLVKSGIAAENKAPCKSPESLTSSNPKFHTAKANLHALVTALVTLQLLIKIGGFTS
jgi:hypothetical protein